MLVLEKPKPEVVQPAGNMEDLLGYMKVSQEIGLDNPNSLQAELFKFFLAQHDMPIFPLKSVVDYMDKLTARDNPSKLGWHWEPVRAKDNNNAWHFGSAAYEYRGGMMGSLGASGESALQQMMQSNLAQMGHVQRSAASDYYFGSRSPYSRTIPLHTLKKIALIEKEFQNPPAFFVSEYTTQPDVVITPDPFLMAVFSPRHRFVIDVWDEPSFGLEARLGLTEG